MQLLRTIRVTLYTTMIYTTLLLIGVIGLIAQAVFGLGHGGHAGGHGHGGGHGHAGGHGHGGHAAHGQTSHGQNGHGERGQTELHGGHGLSPLWTALSPLTLFSLCLGIGATGLLLTPFHWTHLVVMLAAFVGGAAFYGLLVRPLWGLVFQFASTPGRALEGAVAGEAEALGHFDSTGRGMVRLTIDGQWVRVLATLEAGEAKIISPGEQLTVVSVDTRANTCRVARL